MKSVLNPKPTALQLFYRIRHFASDQRFTEIVTGSVWSLGARVVSTASGLLASVIVARWYGADIVGVIAMINSILMLTTTVTVAGTNTSILRLIPEYMVKYSAISAFRLYRKTQWIVIGFSVILAVILLMTSDFVAAQLFSKPHMQFYVALSAIFIVFKSLSMLNTEAVRGLKLIRTFAVMQLLPTATYLILLVILMAVVSSRAVPVYAFLTSLAVAAMVGMVIMDVAFKRSIKPEEPVHVASTVQILAISWPMFLTASMVLIISQTGIVMLGMFATEAEVGYYAIAVKIATLTSFVIASINSMAAPKFSELYHSGSLQDLFDVAQKSSKLIFWATAPILTLLAVFGSPILGYLFGQDFAVAYLPLIVLAAGQFINSICGCTGIFMNMTGHQKTFRNIVAVSAIVNVALNYVLIPPLGILGSAIASSVSIALWNIVTLIYIRLKYGRNIGYVPLLS